MGWHGDRRRHLINRYGVYIVIPEPRPLHQKDWLLLTWHCFPSPPGVISGIQCSAVITRWIFSQIFTKNLLDLHKTPHGSPVRARYGVSFVDTTSEWYSVSVLARICVISYNIEPRYNGTELYRDLRRIYGNKRKWEYFFMTHICDINQRIHVLEFSELIK